MRTRVPSVVPQRVLLVDDNADGADLLATLLEAGGHQVRVAHDGAQAQVIAREFRPDVAVLDIGLPRMDGYELAVRLRKLASGRPMRFVALTGQAQLAEDERSREAAFDMHFLKPLEIDQVDAIVGGGPPPPRHSGVYSRHGW